MSSSFQRQDGASIPGGDVADVQGHTPGPWIEQETETIVDIDGVGGWQDIGPADGNPVAIALGWSAWPREDPEQEANARLIAAAPDLFAFANALDASWAESFPEGPDGPCEIPAIGGHLADEHRALWLQCRAAIAKARASQPAAPMGGE
jgi:hypothetical protein